MAIAEEDERGGTMLLLAALCGTWTRKREPIGSLVRLAEWTGLEPATPGVTGRYSNRLNYHSALTLLPDFSGIADWLRQPAMLASPRGFEPRLSP